MDGWRVQLVKIIACSPSEGMVVDVGCSLKLNLGAVPPDPLGLFRSRGDFCSPF